MKRVALVLGRLWLVEKAGLLGGFGIAALAVGLIASFFVPVGDGSIVEGTIVGFGQVNAEGGPTPTVAVRLSTGEVVTLGASRGHGCLAGDRVTVEFTRTLWGQWPRLRDC